MRHQIAYVLFCLLLREFALSKAFFEMPRKKVFLKCGVYEYSISIYSIFLKIGMIDNLGWFEDNARIATWWFSG